MIARRTRPGAAVARRLAVAALRLAVAGAAVAACALVALPPAEAAAQAPHASSSGAPPIALGTASWPLDSLAVSPYVIHALDGVDHEAELLRLGVPETHASPTGRHIVIALLRFRSTAVAPGPPIVFLPGGPGYPGSLLARAPFYVKLFERLRSQSDVLVLDQRGAGFSVPNLQCVTKGSLPPDAFASGEKVTIALGTMLRPCVRLIRDDGVDVSAYNTRESAEDLEDLRRVLGADRLRLIGASYGTELALEYVRLHGDRVDRVVLAGTRGPDQAYQLPSTVDVQLRRFSTLVATDPDFGPTLPDFAGAVRHELETLRWRPASLVIRDAKSGKRVRVTVGDIGLQAIVAADMSDWVRGVFLPAMVASLARGDSALFTKRVEDLYNDQGGGISVMQVAVDCASGGSPERIAQVAREAKTSLLGNVRNVLMNPAFCDLVGGADLGPAFREPIESDVPALFLSGSNDGITPPFEAEAVAWGFPQGVHLVVRNGWHDTLPFAAVQDAVADFFAGQDLRGRRLEIPEPRFASVERAKELLLR
ncbi:MAG: alpha/beta fold hydrolase [Hyphomicrobiales bacterium]